MREEIKTQLKIWGFMFLVGLLILGGLSALRPQEVNINETSVGGTTIINNLQRNQLTWNDITLRDDTIYSSNGSATASHNGMSAYFPIVNVPTMNGKDISIDATFTTNRTENTTYIFAYQGKLESASLYWYHNYSHTYDVISLQDSYITNYQVDGVAGYNNLGVPNSSCQLGSIHNSKMYQVLFTLSTGQNHSTIYCFNTITTVNATSYRISGNNTVSVNTPKTGYAYDYDDVSSLVSDITDTLPVQLKKNFTFYKIEDVKPGSYNLRFVFTPEGEAKKGKFHVLAYPSSKGIIQAYQDGDYMYQDPAWNSTFSNGLAYYYGFNEGSGTATNSNATALTLTLSNTNLWTATGKNYSALLANGVATVSGGNLSGLNTTSFTIAFWMNNTASAGYHEVLGNTNGDGGAQGNTFDLYKNAVGLGFRISGGSLTLDGNNNVPVGAWTHVTYVVTNGQKTQLYLNGVWSYNSTNPVTNWNGATGNFQMFHSASGTSTGTSEKIDELAMWNRALSATEIAGLAADTYYSSGSSPPSDSSYPIFSNVVQTPSSPITYSQGATYIFNSTIINLNGTVLLEFNGVNYSATNLSSVFTKSFTDLKAGTYVYKWIAFGNGTSTLLNTTVSANYVISQANSTMTLLLNNSASDLNLTYPNQINASGYASPNGITLYRNGVNVTSQNGLFEDLKAGYYNFTLINSGNENYSVATISRFANISSAVPSLSLTFSPSNSVTSGTITTVSGVGCPSQLQCNLTRNGIVVSNPDIQTLSAGAYYYNFTTPSSENYTFAQSGSSLLNVTNAPLISVNVSLDYPNGNKLNTNLVNLYSTIDFTNSNVTNFTLTLWNSTTLVYNYTNLSLQKGRSNNGGTCYQETANASSLIDSNCSLIYTGSYAIGNYPDTYFYVNYTKPSNALNSSKWQIKFGNNGTSPIFMNISIPSDCFYYNPTKLIFRVYSFWGGSLGTGGTSYGQCYNGAWINITLISSLIDAGGGTGGTSDWSYGYDGSYGNAIEYVKDNTFNTWWQFSSPATSGQQSYANLYEEAMLWQITSTSTAQTSNNVSLVDGSYIWNLVACVNNTVGNSICSNNANATFSIDTIPPSVALSLSNSSTKVVNFNLTMTPTVSDLNLDSCYYTTSDSATHVSFSCNTPTVVSFSSSGIKNVTIVANDSYGNINSASSIGYIYYMQESISATASPLSEGSSDVISLTLNQSDFPIGNAEATLYWNGSTLGYDTKSVIDSNTIRFTKTFTIPTGLGSPIGNNVNYYWTWNSTKFANSQTQTNVQQIISVSLTNCSASSTQILGLLLKDEATNTLVSTANSTDLEINLMLTSKLNTSQTFQYNLTYLYRNYLPICVPNNLLNNSNYTIDFTVGFTSANHVFEYYYLDNGTLTSNTTSFNSMTNSNISLMDLDSADSTTFLFKFTDQDGLTVPNGIVHVFRDYIGDGMFREVERGRMDDNGQTHLHLVEEDVIYYFVISQYGNIIYTSDQYNAKCLSTPCTIELSASGSVGTFPPTNDIFQGISFSSNRSTRAVILSYVYPDVTTINMTLYEYGKVPVAINSSVLTASSGVLSQSIPLTYGNKTFFVAIYKNGEFLGIKWIDFKPTGQDFFGLFGAILGGMVILAIVLITLGEGGVVTIVGIIVGIIAIGLMMLVELSWLALISVICAGGVIIWAIIRRKR